MISPGKLGTNSMEWDQAWGKGWKAMGRGACRIELRLWKAPSELSPGMEEFVYGHVPALGAPGVLGRWDSRSKGATVERQYARICTMGRLSGADCKQHRGPEEGR